MHSTLTPPMNAAEGFRRAMLAFAGWRRFVLLMSSSDSGSQPGSQPGAPTPTDSANKKKDDGQTTDGTKPMDPPTVQKKAIASPGLRAAFEA